MSAGKITPDSTPKEVCKAESIFVQIFEYMTSNEKPTDYKKNIKAEEAINQLYRKSMKTNNY